MAKDAASEKLNLLGKRLKTFRIERNDPQKEFAFRIGVSIPTLHKMEKGDPSVSIGKWIKALFILDRLDDLDHVLSSGQSLFARVRGQTNSKARSRVKRRRKP